MVCKTVSLSQGYFFCPFPHLLSRLRWFLAGPWALLAPKMILAVPLTLSSLFHICTNICPSASPSQSWDCSNFLQAVHSWPLSLLEHQGDASLLQEQLFGSSHTSECSPGTEGATWVPGATWGIQMLMNKHFRALCALMLRLMLLEHNLIIEFIIQVTHKPSSLSEWHKTNTGLSSCAEFPL